MSFFLDKVLPIPWPAVTERPGMECYKDGNHAGLCFFPQFNDLVRLEVIAGGHAAYIIILAILYFLMKGKPAADPKGPMTLYNLTQVILSATMTIALFPNMFTGMTIFNLDGKFTASMEFWVLVHYLTKYLDMFDTIWMVLRHKENQISFLHVYHHLTIGAIWGILLHYGVGNGTAFYGAWINSLVHTLMYFHYLVTSYGFNNPLKKYLTQFQIAQFFSCVIHAIILPLVEQTNFPAVFAYLQMSYHSTLIVLFVNFYRKSIAGGKKKKDIKKKE